MGRNKNKYRIRRDVYVSWEILESEALNKLSATGTRVLLRFLQKRTWEKGKIPGKGSRKKIVYDNGGLVFTYTEAKAMGISTSQFHAVLRKLHEVGFIDIEHQGGMYGKDYSRYTLSERWKNYNTGSFKLIEKRRTLWPGHDVQSRMEKQKSLRESVVDNYGNP
jgi:hypothetical protein